MTSRRFGEYIGNGSEDYKQRLSRREFNKKCVKGCKGYELDSSISPVAKGGIRQENGMNISPNTICDRRMK